MKNLAFAALIFFTFLICAYDGFCQNTGKTMVASFNGNIFRSDTKAGVPNVRVILLDEKKSGKQNNSTETTTDDKGDFLFSDIKPGKYTLAIEAVFDHEEDVPCQLLIGKVDEPNSSVLVETKEGKEIEHIFVKGFTVKAGKEIRKEIDLVCKSLFGK